MLNALIQLVIWLVIAGVIWWAVQQLLPLLPIGEPFLKIINVLLTVIIVIIVLYALVGLLSVLGGARFSFPRFWGATEPYLVLTG